MHVQAASSRSVAYKSATPREAEHQSNRRSSNRRAQRSFSHLLDSNSRHEVHRRYRSVRLGGGPRGGQTHQRGGVRRAGGRAYFTGSGQEQARVAVQRGLHGTGGRLQCIHRAAHVLRIQLPLCVHGLFELPLLRRRVQRALLLGLDTYGGHTDTCATRSTTQHAKPKLRANLISRRRR